MLKHAAPTVNMRLATGAKVISYEELQDAQQLKQQETAAKNALDIALGIKTKKTKPDRSLAMLEVEEVGADKAGAGARARAEGGAARERERRTAEPTRRAQWKTTKWAESGGTARRHR